jgi:hypothetical protein
MRQRLLLACTFTLVVVTAAIPVRRYVLYSETPRAASACP